MPPCWPWCKLHCSSKGKSPTYILDEDTHPVKRAIGVSHTACKDDFRRNVRSHSWSVFLLLQFTRSPEDIQKKSPARTCYSMLSVRSQRTAGQDHLAARDPSPSVRLRHRTRAPSLPARKAFNWWQMMPEKTSIVAIYMPGMLQHMKKIKILSYSCDIEDLAEIHICTRCVIIKK